MSLIRSFLRQRGRGKRRKASPVRNRVLFEVLEPRFLLDGTGLDPDSVTFGVTHDDGAVELVVDLSAETNALIGELDENSLS